MLLNKLLIVTLVSVFVNKATCEESIFYGRNVTEVKTPGEIEEQFDNVLECIRIIIKNGIPGVIPTLDPFVLDKTITYNSTDSVVTGDFEISNIIVYGVSSFVTKSLDFTFVPPKLTYSLYANVTSVGDYKARGYLLNIAPVSGEGRFNLNFKGNAFGNVIFGFDEIEQFLVFLEIDPTFFISGLVKTDFLSSIVSRQAAAVTKQIVNSNQELISKLVSPLIKDYVNMILKPEDPTSEVVQLVKDFVEEHCVDNSRELIIRIITPVIKQYMYLLENHEQFFTDIFQTGRDYARMQCIDIPALLKIGKYEFV